MDIEAQKYGLNMDSIKIKKLYFDNTDTRESAIKKHIKGMSKHLNLLYKDFYYPSNKAIKGSNSRLMFAWHAIQLNYVVPVCLAGIGNFNVRDKKGSRKVISILQVLPFADKTIVVMLVPIKHERCLSLYISQFWDSDLDIIKSIETWMIHGSDHWFIKPSIWGKIFPTQQRMILDAIWDISNNIGSTTEHDIFIDLKSKMV